MNTSSVSTPDPVAAREACRRDSEAVCTECEDPGPFAVDAPPGTITGGFPEPGGKTELELIVPGPVGAPEVVEVDIDVVDVDVGVLGLVVVTADVVDVVGAAEDVVDIGDVVLGVGPHAAKVLATPE